MGRAPPTRNSASYAAVSDAFGPLSTPAGVPWDPSLDRPAREGIGIRFLALCRLSHRFYGSFRPVAIACYSSLCRLGSGFIPMTEGLWLIHVTEPVTETIS